MGGVAQGWTHDKSDARIETDDVIAAAADRMAAMHSQQSSLSLSLSTDASELPSEDFGTPYSTTDLSAAAVDEVHDYVYDNDDGDTDADDGSDHDF
eukprot:COSAG02_NODE_40548_length_404_cov_0.845902_1_plen_95_part_01